MKQLLFLLPAVFLAACSGGAPSEGPETFDVQGHRGCRGLMPENSIPAFLKALDIGVTTLELDVVISKDKQVVVSHEPFLSATICTETSGAAIEPSNERKWNLYEMDYADILKCDCGSKGHPDFPEQQPTAVHKPLLKDVFTAVEAQIKATGAEPVWYNIETKSTIATDEAFHPKPEEFVALLLAVIQEAGLEDRVIIQSFDPRTLIALHDKAPEMKTALLVTNQLGYRHNLQRLDFKPTIFSPNDIFITQNMIDFMHGEGIKVIPWTVNKEERMKELMAMGVDGIITDYPDRLVAIGVVP